MANREALSILMANKEFSLKKKKHQRTSEYLMRPAQRSE